MAQFDLVRREVEAYGAHVTTYGFDPSADVRVLSWDPQPMTSDVQATVQGETLGFTVHAPGKGMVSNALAAVAVAMLRGLDLRRVADGISNFSLPGSKLEPLRYSLPGGELTVVDDSYSGAPLAMKSAFEVALRFPISENGRRIAVLGRMVDLGAQAEKLHRGLAEPLMRAGFSLVITHGEEMLFLRDELPEGVLGPHFNEAGVCARTVAELVKGGDLLLIKGSRRASDFAKVGRIVRSRLVRRVEATSRH